MTYTSLKFLNLGFKVARLTHFPFFVVFFFLFSCSLHQQEDFVLQGKGELDSLTHELKQIQDLEMLLKHKKSLKKKFNRITQIMVDYHDFLERYPELIATPNDALVLSAAALKMELLRLFEIEGAMEAIIEAEKEAYLKLTLMEENLSRKPL